MEKDLRYYEIDYDSKTGHFLKKFRRWPFLRP